MQAKTSVNWHCTPLKLPVWIHNFKGTRRLPPIFLIGSDDRKRYDVWPGQSQRNRHSVKYKQDVFPGPVHTSAVFSVPGGQEYTVYVGKDLQYSQIAKVRIGSPEIPATGRSPKTKKFPVPKKKKKGPVRENRFFSN